MQADKAIEQMDATELQKYIQDYLKEYSTIREILREYVLPVLLKSCGKEHTEDGKTLYATDAITAYANAARLLEKFGFVKIVDEISHRFVLFEVLDPNISGTIAEIS